MPDGMCRSIPSHDCAHGMKVVKEGVAGRVLGGVDRLVAQSQQGDVLPLPTFPQTGGSAVERAPAVQLYEHAETWRDAQTARNHDLGLTSRHLRSALDGT